MSFRTNAGPRRVAMASVGCLLLLALAGCDATKFPQSTLNPKGDFARMVDGLFMTDVWFALGVFILVEGALLYAMIKFRGKPTDAEPEQVHGNTFLEIVWTAIPALILAFIAVPTVRTIFRTYEVPTDNPLVVEVIGHQWWWEFRYPQYGLTTANELHVPLNRAVSLKMTAIDVLHSFWLPQFAAKRDVFPNRNTVLWFRAEVEGLYSGQCAEFCGLQHGRMGFHVVAESDAAFEQYIAGLKATAPVAAAKPDTTATKTTTAGATVAPKVPPPGAPIQVIAVEPLAAPSATPSAAPTLDSAQAAGQKLFTSKGCVGCHSLDATKSLGIGPNLANVGGRSHIAAGQYENTDANLAHWIREPQSLKHGVLMPNLGVSEADANALVAFLRTRK